MTRTTNGITRSRFLLALAAPAGLLAGSNNASGRLSEGERREIVELLHQSQSATLTMLAGLGDAQWSFKPGPDRWSAGEVFEHLMLSEKLFHAQVDGLMERGPNPQWEKLSAGQQATITQVVPDRSQKAQAPPPLEPKGAMSRIALVEAYSAARARTIELTFDPAPAYKAHIADSGTPLGPLSAAHWLRFAALHNQRHNKQIHEVLGDAKFPG